MTRIILVEDECEIAELIVEGLQSRGFEVTHFPGGAFLLDKAAQIRPDLILLDIMLPGEDGLSLCRRLRAEGSSLARTPIIFLTALGDLTDKVVGLEMGADDYLVKPFEMGELVARIRALLRRSGFAATPEAADARAKAGMLRFGAWRLDPLSRCLIDENGVTVALSSMEFRLLDYFLSSPFRVLTRDQILERIGSRAQSYDRSLDVQISRLRAKLGDNARHPTLIRTMRGDGYMLAVDVERTT